MTALTTAFEDNVDLIIVGVTAIAIAGVGVVALKVGFAAFKGMFGRSH